MGSSGFSTEFSESKPWVGPNLQALKNFTQNLGLFVGRGIKETKGVFDCTANFVLSLHPPETD